MEDFEVLPKTIEPNIVPIDNQSSGTNISSGGQNVSANTPTGGVASSAPQQVFNIQKLSEITGDLGDIVAGTITMPASGYVRAGQNTYNNGAGFFLGYSPSASAHQLSIGDGTTANSLTWDGTTLRVGNYIVGSEAVTIYGTGVDGDATISTDTTLTSDKFYKNLTVNSSKTLNNGGYNIYVSGTLTNNGTISNNGSDGVAANDNLGGNGGAGGAGVSFAAAPSGSNGSTSLAQQAGVSSSAGTSKNPSLGVSGAQGGSGGAGAAFAGASAGAAGTATSENLSLDAGFLPSIIVSTGVNTGQGISQFKGATSLSTLSTSAGSSGGASGGPGINNPAAYGGGGGGGGGAGGILTLYAKTIVNTGTISANGGAGGAGGNTSYTNAGGGGGGGGGSGGVVLMVYNSLTNSGTISASAGTGGALGAKNGTGSNGTAGANGTAGKIYKVNIP